MVLEFLSSNALSVSIAFFLAGAILSLVFASKSRLSSMFGCGFALAGSLFALIAGILALLGAGVAGILVVRARRNKK